MKKTFLFILLSFNIFITYAQTGNGYEKAVIDFMDVTNSKETMVTTIATMYQNMNIPVSNMQVMCEEIVNMMWPTMIKGYTEIMRQYYSLDDLNAIIAFYKTSAGKKFAKYNPIVAQKVMDYSYNTDIVSKIQEIILRYVNKKI